MERNNDDQQPKHVLADRHRSTRTTITYSGRYPTKQNKIMKDILRYQGMHDVEKILYDCPLPYDEELSTPLGYNAPNIPKKIIEDN